MPNYQLEIPLFWLIYKHLISLFPTDGVIIADQFIYVPNVIGVMLGVFQMALFGKFPSKSKDPIKSSLPI